MYHARIYAPMKKTSSDTSDEEILDQPADTRALTPAFCMAPRIVRVRVSTSCTTMEPKLRFISGYDKGHTNPIYIGVEPAPKKALRSDGGW